MSTPVCTACRFSRGQHLSPALFFCPGHGRAVGTRPKNNHLDEKYFCFILNTLREICLLFITRYQIVLRCFFFLCSVHPSYIPGTCDVSREMKEETEEANNSLILVV